VAPASPPPLAPQTSPPRHPLSSKEAPAPASCAVSETTALPPSEAPSPPLPQTGVAREAAEAGDLDAEDSAVGLSLEPLDSAGADEACGGFSEGGGAGAGKGRLIETRSLDPTTRSGLKRGREDPDGLDI